jgi:hypothetical protein
LSAKISNPKSIKHGTRDLIKKANDSTPREKKDRVFNAGFRKGRDSVNLLRDSIVEAQAERIEKIHGILRFEDHRNFILTEGLLAACHDIFELRSELTAARNRLAELESENRRLQYAHLKPLPPPRNKGILLTTTIPRKKKPLG